MNTYIPMQLHFTVFHDLADDLYSIFFSSVLFFGHIQSSKLESEFILFFKHKAS